MASLIETKVLSFGANGDGLVLIKDKPAYIPETVPGDTLRLRYDDSRHVELIDILAPSPDRSPLSVPFSGVAVAARCRPPPVRPCWTGRSGWFSMP
ncbi:hypothetical protein [Asaia prunellae]|uniref:hypothetical protein n=1 Tax=Asaia prunellae TaxID=610245 RepID=UPI001FB1007C|nr:hypothetical protein [Asaia prunellae]